MKILIADGATLTQSGDISLEVFSRFGEVTFYDNISYDRLLSIIPEYNAVLCNKTPITREVITRGKKLEYIGVFATGYNNIDIDAAREHGVTVCNAGSYSTDAVAQQTFAYILNHYNKVSQYDALVKSGEWQKSETFSVITLPTDELAGKTIGIIGYGKIGRRVADIALAFSMKVLVFNRSPKQDERVVFTDLDSLLKSCDIVTVHCPLNEQSLDMFNKSAFDKMKKGALFINTARGPLVVEKDLLDALSEGKLFAAVDVLREEPMSKDCLLKDAPNILITPHIGWAPKETRKRLVEIAANTLHSFIKGAPVNVVS